jgi:signal transduction histidine kinase
MVSALSGLALAHPRWVATGVVLIAVLVWAASLTSIVVQIGHPFPGFFYTPDRIVSGFTPRDFTGPQAGLRPWDRIVAVNGQHWREMRRLVREAGIGTPLVYTVERGNQRFQIAVPTMEFTADILWRFIPGGALFAFTSLVVGLFIYARNPAGRLNRYLLFYLLCWASIVGGVWNTFLSQQKWTAYLIHPWTAITTVAGWIFFWSFPADRARKEFLARWPLLPSFVALVAAFTVYFPALFFLASRLDEPALWRLYLWSGTWGHFLILGVGSLVNKLVPLLQIALKRRTTPLIRQQAVVLLVGISLGLGGWIVFLWAPATLHIPPPASIHWGGIIATLYPLSVGYAVLRYQLFDIRVVVRKGLVYSLLTAILTAVFLVLSLLTGYLFQGLTGQQSFLSALIPALFIAFLFQPARSRIQTFVDRTFFRREVEMRQALTAFSLGLSTLRDRDEVIRLMLETVTKTMGAQKATLWLPKGERYRPVGSAGEDEAVDVWGLAVRLERGRRPLSLLPGERSPQAEELRRIGAVLAVPLLVGESLVGILTLGEKRSGDLYTQEDVGLLTTLAQSAAFALENARLHEERIAMLRQQLARVTAAQEEERRRIARELHDGVGPTLAGANLRLRTARKLLEQDHHPAAEEVEEIAEQVQASIQDIRRLIYDLRPAVLDELGLVPALREYVVRYQEEQGLEVVLSLPEGEMRLPAPLETALFRILQEALNNVARHARARRVEVRLTWDEERVTLHVADDGQGFDPRAAQVGAHVGLWSMRERVKQLGGRFEVESAPGAGTKVEAVIPLEAGV